jgi:hypothetical protein
MALIHKHRILPGHLGGTYAPDNVELLTVSDHAEAHRLLWENFGCQADWIAWQALNGTIGKEEIIRAVLAATKGIPQSSEHKLKRGIYRPKSKEHKRKISVAHQGSKKPWAAVRTEATRHKMSLAMKTYLIQNPEARRGKNNPMFGKSRPDLAERNRQRAISVRDNYNSDSQELKGGEFSRSTPRWH